MAEDATTRPPAQEPPGDTQLMILLAMAEFSNADASTL
jgi:hypothetical protein